jgi:hypothetical protein
MRYEAKIIETILNKEGVERLRDWAEVGPVQRAALDLFVSELVHQITEAMWQQNIERFGMHEGDALKVIMESTREIRRTVFSDAVIEQEHRSLLRAIEILDAFSNTPPKDEV